MLIRLATQYDVDEITACVANAYSMYIPRLGRPPGPMLESYSDVIASKDVFVAEKSGIIIGVLVLGSAEGVFSLRI
jgi:hypothetical protein